MSTLQCFCLVRLEFLCILKSPKTRISEVPINLQPAAAPPPDFRDLFESAPGFLGIERQVSRDDLLHYGNTAETLIKNMDVI